MPGSPAQKMYFESSQAGELSISYSLRWYENMPLPSVTSAYIWLTAIIKNNGTTPFRGSVDLAVLTGEGHALRPVKLESLRKKLTAATIPEKAATAIAGLRAMGNHDMANQAEFALQIKFAEARRLADGIFDWADRHSQKTKIFLPAEGALTLVQAFEFAQTLPYSVHISAGEENVHFSTGMSMSLELH